MVLTENIKKSQLSMISVKDKELNEKNYINNIVCSRSPTPNPARTPSDEAPPDSALTVPHVNLKEKDESDKMLGY